MASEKSEFLWKHFGENGAKINLSNIRDSLTQLFTSRGISYVSSRPSASSVGRSQSFKFAAELSNHKILDERGRARSLVVNQKRKYQHSFSEEASPQSSCANLSGIAELDVGGGENGDKSNEWRQNQKKTVKILKYRKLEENTGKIRALPTACRTPVATRTKKQPRTRRGGRKMIKVLPSFISRIGRKIKGSYDFAENTQLAADFQNPGETDKAMRGQVSSLSICPVAEEQVINDAEELLDKNRSSYGQISILSSSSGYSTDMSRSESVVSSLSLATRCAEGNNENVKDKCSSSVPLKFDAESCLTDHDVIVKYTGFDLERDADVDLDTDGPTCNLSKLKSAEFGADVGNELNTKYDEPTENCAGVLSDSDSKLGIETKFCVLSDIGGAECKDVVDVNDKIARLCRSDVGSGGKDFHKIGTSSNIFNEDSATSVDSKIVEFKNSNTCCDQLTIESTEKRAVSGNVQSNYDEDTANGEFISSCVSNAAKNDHSSEQRRGGSVPDTRICRRNDANTNNTNSSLFAKNSDEKLDKQFMENIHDLTSVDVANSVEIKQEPEFNSGFKASDNGIDNDPFVEGITGCIVSGHGSPRCCRPPLSRDLHVNNTISGVHCEKQPNSISSHTVLGPGATETGRQNSTAVEEQTIAVVINCADFKGFNDGAKNSRVRQHPSDDGRTDRQLTSTPENQRCSADCLPGRISSDAACFRRAADAKDTANKNIEFDVEKENDVTVCEGLKQEDYLCRPSASELLVKTCSARDTKPNALDLSERSQPLVSYSGDHLGILRDKLFRKYFSDSALHDANKENIHSDDVDLSDKWPSTGGAHEVQSYVSNVDLPKIKKQPLFEVGFIKTLDVNVMSTSLQSLDRNAPARRSLPRSTKSETDNKWDSFMRGTPVRRSASGRSLPRAPSSTENVKNSALKRDDDKRKSLSTSAVNRNSSRVAKERSPATKSSVSSADVASKTRRSSDTQPLTPETAKIIEAGTGKATPIVDKGASMDSVFDEPPQGWFLKPGVDCSSSSDLAMPRSVRDSVDSECSDISTASTPGRFAFNNSRDSIARTQGPKKTPVVKNTDKSSLQRGKAQSATITPSRTATAQRRTLPDTKSPSQGNVRSSAASYSNTFDRLSSTRSSIREKKPAAGLRNTTPSVTKSSSDLTPKRRAPLRPGSATTAVTKQDKTSRVGTSASEENKWVRPTSASRPPGGNVVPNPLQGAKDVKTAVKTVKKKMNSPTSAARPSSATTSRTRDKTSLSPGLKTASLKTSPSLSPDVKNTDVSIKKDKNRAETAKTDEKKTKNRPNVLPLKDVDQDIIFKFEDLRSPLSPTSKVSFSVPAAREAVRSPPPSGEKAIVGILKSPQKSGSLNELHKIQAIEFMTPGSSSSLPRKRDLKALIRLNNEKPAARVRFGSTSMLHTPPDSPQGQRRESSGGEHTSTELDNILNNKDSLQGSLPISFDRSSPKFSPRNITSPLTLQMLQRSGLVTSPSNSPTFNTSIHRSGREMPSPPLVQTTDLHKTAIQSVQQQDIHQKHCSTPPRLMSPPPPSLGWLKIHKNQSGGTRDSSSPHPVVGIHGVQNTKPERREVPPAVQVQRRNIRHSSRDASPSSSVGGSPPREVSPTATTHHMTSMRVSSPLHKILIGMGDSGVALQAGVNSSPRGTPASSDSEVREINMAAIRMYDQASPQGTPVSSDNESKVSFSGSDQSQSQSQLSAVVRILKQPPSSGSESEKDRSSTSSDGSRKLLTFKDVVKMRQEGKMQQSLITATRSVKEDVGQKLKEEAKFTVVSRPPTPKKKTSLTRIADTLLAPQINDKVALEDVPVATSESSDDSVGRVISETRMAYSVVKAQGSTLVTPAQLLKEPHLKHQFSRLNEIEAGRAKCRGSSESDTGFEEASGGDLEITSNSAKPAATSYGGLVTDVADGRMPKTPESDSAPALNSSFSDDSLDELDEDDSMTSCDGGGGAQKPCIYEFTDARVSPSNGVTCSRRDDVMTSGSERTVGGQAGTHNASVTGINGQQYATGISDGCPQGSAACNDADPGVGSNGGGGVIAARSRSESGYNGDVSLEWKRSHDCSDGARSNLSRLVESEVTLLFDQGETSANTTTSTMATAYGLESSCEVYADNSAVISIGDEDHLCNNSDADENDTVDEIVKMRLQPTSVADAAARRRVSYKMANNLSVYYEAVDGVNDGSGVDERSVARLESNTASASLNRQTAASHLHNPLPHCWPNKTKSNSGDLNLDFSGGNAEHERNQTLLPSVRNDARKTLKLFKSASFDSGDDVIRKETDGNAFVGQSSTSHLFSGHKLPSESPSRVKPSKKSSNPTTSVEIEQQLRYLANAPSLKPSHEVSSASPVVTSSHVVELRSEELAIRSKDVCRADQTESESAGSGWLNLSGEYNYIDVLGTGLPSFTAQTLPTSPARTDTPDKPVKLVRKKSDPGLSATVEETRSNPVLSSVDATSELPSSPVTEVARKPVNDEKTSLYSQGISSASGGPPPVFDEDADSLSQLDEQRFSTARDRFRARRSISLPSNLQNVTRQPIQGHVKDYSEALNVLLYKTKTSPGGDDEHQTSSGMPPLTTDQISSNNPDNNMGGEESSLHHGSDCSTSSSETYAQYQAFKGVRRRVSSSSQSSYQSAMWRHSWGDSSFSGRSFSLNRCRKKGVANNEVFNYDEFAMAIDKSDVKTRTPDTPVDAESSSVAPSGGHFVKNVSTPSPTQHVVLRGAPSNRTRPRSSGEMTGHMTGHMTSLAEDLGAPSRAISEEALSGGADPSPGSETLNKSRSETFLKSDTVRQSLGAVQSLQDVSNSERKAAKIKKDGLSFLKMMFYKKRKDKEQSVSQSNFYVINDVTATSASTDSKIDDVVSDSDDKSEESAPPGDKTGHSHLADDELDWNTPHLPQTSFISYMPERPLTSDDSDSDATASHKPKLTLSLGNQLTVDNTDLPPRPHSPKPSSTPFRQRSGSAHPLAESHNDTSFVAEHQRARTKSSPRTLKLKLVRKSKSSPKLGRRKSSLERTESFRIPRKQRCDLLKDDDEAAFVRGVVYRGSGTRRVPILIQSKTAADKSVGPKKTVLFETEKIPDRRQPLRASVSDSRLAVSHSELTPQDLRSMAAEVRDKFKVIAAVDKVQSSTERPKVQFRTQRHPKANYFNNRNGEIRSSKQRPKSDIGGALLISDALRDHEFRESLLNNATGNSHTSMTGEWLNSADGSRRHRDRRMSTPHPIKLRQEKRLPAQKRRQSLQRSCSAPDGVNHVGKYVSSRTSLMLAALTAQVGDLAVSNLTNLSSSDNDDSSSLDSVSLVSRRSSQCTVSHIEDIFDGEPATFAEALWDHVTMDPDELPFRAGEVIEVTDMLDKDWWWGCIVDAEGWFPAAFVRLRANQEETAEDFAQKVRSGQLDSKTAMRRMSMSFVSKDQARSNVVNEIISAERDYVKHLKDVVQGYIAHARKRPEMFSAQTIARVFGNLEDIYTLAQNFLKSLESAYDPSYPHVSQIGLCFLKHHQDFVIYSEYCNNHAAGCAELQQLGKHSKYQQFFEACRLLQDMIEIPLEGFLLTPVQKICKYPLQLAELLKYTHSSHRDYDDIQDALDAMKEIATLINERKRKLESIEKISVWQKSVQDWQGEDLLETSSELIHQGELSKVTLSSGWAKDRVFFLFDHQLIYCKKDLLKRNMLTFSGRVDMDCCDVVDVADGKDSQFNLNARNAWKVYDRESDKWLMLYAKSSADKMRWLQAFRSERDRVQEDLKSGFRVTEQMKHNITHGYMNRVRPQKPASVDKSRTPRKISSMPFPYKHEVLRELPTPVTLPHGVSNPDLKQRKPWLIFSSKKAKR